MIVIMIHVNVHPPPPAPFTSRGGLLVIALCLCTGGHLPQSRATTEIVRAATMFSLLKYFFTYSAIIAMKFGHYIPEGLKMMIL